MKKYLLAGAAALLLSTLGASATTYVVKLNNHADVFTVTSDSDGPYFAQVHRWGNSNGGTGNESYGAGMLAFQRNSTGKESQVMILTDFAYGGQMQVCYQFDRPFKTGGHWIAYGSMNGHSALYLGKGTYSVIDTNLAK